jgi:hypothetical protein
MKKHETGKKGLAGAWQICFVPKLLMMAFSDFFYLLFILRNKVCNVRGTMYIVHVRVEKIILCPVYLWSVEVRLQMQHPN